MVNICALFENPISDHKDVKQMKNMAMESPRYVNDLDLGLRWQNSAHCHAVVCTELFQNHPITADRVRPWSKVTVSQTLQITSMWLTFIPRHFKLSQGVEEK